MITTHIITGVSGTGKTTLVPLLKTMIGDKFNVYDFDDLGVPDDADVTWRKGQTETWLQKIIAGQKNSILVGQMQPDEVMQSPSAHALHIRFALLEAPKDMIRARLRERYDHDHSKEQFIEETLNYTDTQKKLAKDYNAALFNTAYSTPEETAHHLTLWIHET